jgi:hypothetical protein
MSRCGEWRDFIERLVLWSGRKSSFGTRGESALERHFRRRARVRERPLVVRRISPSFAAISEYFPLTAETPRS